MLENGSEGSFGRKKSLFRLGRGDVEDDGLYEVGGEVVVMKERVMEGFHETQVIFHRTGQISLRRSTPALAELALL